MKLPLVLLIGLISFSGHTQDLGKHKWENRLLIIRSSDVTDNRFLDQLNVLKKDPSGLVERKLMAYQFSPNGYRRGLETTKKWNSTNNIIEEENLFEVVLIGLDGGVKAKKTTIFTTEELYKLIDSMPMRQAEMRPD